MRQRSWLPVLLLLVLSQPWRAGGQPRAQIEADWLEVNAGPGLPLRVRAVGNVRVRQDGCHLEASELGVEGRRLHAEQARLRVCDLCGLELQAPQLRLSPGLEAGWPRLGLCGCGARRPLLGLGARRALVAPGGSRLHLSWPALWVGSRRVLTIPYLALPLRRGVSGLLLPQLGWSHRDGFRLEQAGYLAAAKADLLLGAGWIQGRGARGRVRGALLADGLAEGELALTGLRDGDRWRGALQLASWLRGRGVGAGLHADLASDPGWPAELEQEPDRVFTPYLRSRAWATAGGGPLVASGTVDLYQDVTAPLTQTRAVRVGAASLVADLLPTTLVGPLSLQAALRLRGWPADQEGPVPLRAILDFGPGLVVAAPLGWLRLSGQAGYRASAVWTDAGADGAALNQHRLAAALEGSLPLVRRYAAGRPLLHRLEPYAGTFASTSLASPIAAQEGAFAAVGVRSSLVAVGLPAPRRRARGELRLEIPLEQPPPALRGALILAGELEVQVPGRLWLQGRWRGRPGSGETVEGRGQACLPDASAAWRSCAGYLRLRELRASDLLEGAALGWPLIDPETRLLPGTLADQVFASLELRWGPASAWIRMALDPAAGRLTQGSYGLRLDLQCRCLRVELLGISRSGQRWPDALARLTLAAPAGVTAACSGPPGL